MGKYMLEGIWCVANLLKCKEVFISDRRIISYVGPRIFATTFIACVCVCVDIYIPGEFLADGFASLF